MSKTDRNIVGSEKKPINGRQNDMGHRRDPSEYGENLSRKRSKKPKRVGSLLILTAILGMLFSLTMIGSGFFIENADERISIDNRTVTLEGKVMDSKIPLNDVEISLKDHELSTRTNSSGFYRIEDIPAGYHEIKVEKEGYQSITFETYLPHMYFGFHPDGEEKHVFGDGNIVMKGDNELDFDVKEGSETVSYGLDEDTTEKILGGLHGALTLFGIITLICSIFALIGGISIMKRGSYTFAVIGGIGGIFSFGFGIGTILAIIALAVLILYSDEFNY